MTVEADIHLAKKARLDSDAAQTLVAAAVATSSSTSLPKSSSVNSDVHPSPLRPYHHILREQDLALASSTSIQDWTLHDGMLCKFRTEHTQRFNKVYAFDMDHTIIMPRSQSKFPIDSDDWKFWQSDIPRRLSELFHSGHGIVFLSNQGALGTKKNANMIDFQRKVDAVVDAVGVPIDFLCATGKNRFRKPLTGMWEFYQHARCSSLHDYHTHGDDPSSSSVVHVAFVGDAAGRPAHGTRKKDFSDGDLKLARNLQVNVCLPLLRCPLHA